MLSQYFVLDGVITIFHKLCFCRLAIVQIIVCSLLTIATLVVAMTGYQDLTKKIAGYASIFLIHHK